MKKKILKLLQSVSVHRWIIIFFALLTFVLLCNTVHEKYPDEFDNITGGYLITHKGVLPYKGFFTHHAPFAYFFAGVITVFSGASFVSFRILLAFVYLLLHIALYLYFKRRFTQPFVGVVLAWSAVISVMATYVWGHMLLADSLVGLLLIPAYMLTLFLHLSDQKPSLRDAVVFSILTAASFLTSITFVFAIVVLVAYFLFLCIERSFSKQVQRRYIKLAAIFAAPYLFFFLYLLVTGSLSDFYYQAVVFNRDFYVGGTASNPLRFAIGIFVKNFGEFRTVLTQLTHGNIASPFAFVFAFSNLVFMLYLLAKKRFTAAAAVFGLLIFLNARSSMLNTTETDYQAAPYHYFSVLNGILVLTLLRKELARGISNATQLLFAVGFVVLSFYAGFFALFQTTAFLNKAYAKYMGEAPLIYNYFNASRYINQLVKPDEATYIGPFSFEDWLYVEGQMASKYWITIPAMDKSEKIQQDLLADLQESQPKLIVFNKEYYIFSNKPGTFLYPLFDEQYQSLSDLSAEKNFAIIDTDMHGYNLREDFLIHRSATDEMLQRFAAAGLIRFVE